MWCKMSVGNYRYSMLSKQSLDILIDLVEIKLSTILVQDKDDIREVRKLNQCRNELLMFRQCNMKCPDVGASEKNQPASCS
jgi:hypothetical protein